MKKMFKRIININVLMMLLVVSAFALYGCSDDDDDGMMAPEDEKSFVRVGHLSPDAGRVDVWVDGTVVLEDVDFATFSKYLELDSGDHRIQVSPANATDPIVIDANVNLAADTYYTVVATGLLANIGAVVLVDDPTTESQNAKIRFIHAGADAPNVDITLTDGTVLFPDVEFNKASSTLSTPGGDYDLQVRVAGTETVALSFGDVGLANGTNYTVFAAGLLADGSLTAYVTVDDSSDGSTVVVLQPATASVRVAHFSPDAPGVDVYLDGELVAGLVDVPFQAISGYLSVSATTHNVKVFVTGTSVDPVIDANVTLNPGWSYTVAATGLVGSADLLPIVLVDDRDGGAFGEALVRFVHFSPDAPAVDIVVQGGPTLFGDVAFRGLTGYDPVAAGTYDLEVRLSEDGGLALSVPGVQLDGSESYTVFAIGLAGDTTLAALLVQDTE
jgi:hypothetical protein